MSYSSKNTFKPIQTEKMLFPPNICKKVKKLRNGIKKKSSENI